MGIYGERILPHLQDRAMGMAGFRDTRERACRGLQGKVVELGFGTGLNIPYYPPSVTKVLAVEPSAVCVRIAGPRIEASDTPVEIAGLDGQALDLDDGIADSVLSTWTLCTIPDAGAALQEVRRVLKNDGRFHFVEHGRAPDAKVRRWQQRVEPFSKPVLGGCHLTRDITGLIEDAGFEIERLDNYYAEHEPKIFGYMYEGVAKKR